ncbi:hypothetical protein [Bosea sp. BK604]|uniref:hypothetical protein n=1 Tax=Bosea sp. BK604 TaxID=2512180 RepID=UPI0010440431|nr:hypothetical protein [Bosea sp. BK604]TCR64652.1 hypothetical protein EV560_106117 [Bosea sp. BK604]
MNHIRINGDVAHIRISQELVAVIDIADLPKVRDHSWFRMPGHGRDYAVGYRRGQGRIPMHRREAK